MREATLSLHFHLRHFFLLFCGRTNAMSSHRRTFRPRPFTFSNFLQSHKHKMSRPPELPLLPGNTFHFPVQFSFLKGVCVLPQNSFSIRFGRESLPKPNNKVFDTLPLLHMFLVPRREPLELSKFFCSFVHSTPFPSLTSHARPGFPKSDNLTHCSFFIRNNEPSYLWCHSKHPCC